MESNVADCIYRSAEIGDGKSYSVGGAPTTIMAGLNCGTTCSLIWPIIWNYTDFYISGSDEMAVDGMRAYAFNKGEDLKIISGESGASTMGALLGVLAEPSMEEIKKK
ncbi:putative diaminopropionate ammonia-lyase [Parvimonas sp. oral taxon 393 str. F0440]|nr:putative diaminopropionate ammonia-lyase [Parvimonas sp. oral taxon 393 str. F0440]